MTEAKDEKLLRVGEIASRLGVAETTVRRIILNGELKAIRLGEKGIFLVREKDLEKTLTFNPTIQTS